MSFSKLLELESGSISPEERQEELEDMEFQVFRMRENMKEISKKYEVIGIDQTKHDHWVIVFKHEDQGSAQIMINDCRGAYRGEWDSCLQLEYRKESTVHINDIKGREDQGYGSILMNHLKEHVRTYNYQYIKGDLVERDWDHLNRLTYFYKKHHFYVEVDDVEQKGEIVWAGE
ncbi:hypothetical protein [Aquisalibacillus elongatus]|uniref:N-acetyltransferase domain-containing protein n=1 Tax=Aquisalibacillus elongatus TaxID=485577 RepID=A0A3N5B9W0_9BACI|nr:hypothetical protein [Aquisalibacillus elongatus]RPF54264.1 hypothetical protein EDC24_1460 [Aquisalibacillus elongatus]